MGGGLNWLRIVCSGGSASKMDLKGTGYRMGGGLNWLRIVCSGGPASKMDLKGIGWEVD
jgi:hypothetical protein